MTKTPAQIAAGLTEAQRMMVRESEPDDVTGKEGCGVELLTGAQYATAKALERKGIGHREGPGGPFTGMYWNNADGLAVREHLEKMTCSTPTFRTV